MDNCEDKCCEGGKYIKGAKGNDGANIIDAKANSAADGKSFTLDFLLDNGRSLTTAPIPLPEGGAGGSDLTALIAAINAAAGNGSLKNIADAIGKISGGSGGVEFVADNRTIKGGTQAEPAAVQVSKADGNALIAKDDGLYAAQGQGGAGGTVKTDNDTLAGDGSAALPLRAVVGALVSPLANNILSIKGGKLFGDGTPRQTAITADNQTLGGQGVEGSPLFVSVYGLVKQSQDNAIQVEYIPSTREKQGYNVLFVPKSSGGLDSVAVSDTADIALSGTGTAAAPLTAALTAAVKANIQQGVDAKAVANAAKTTADAANKTALEAANQVNGKLNNDFTRGDGKDFEAANGKVLTAQNGKAVWADTQGGEAAIDQTARDAAAAAQVQANKAGKDASDALGTANAAQTAANDAKTQTDKLKKLAFKDTVATADIDNGAITPDKLEVYGGQLITKLYADSADGHTSKVILAPKLLGLGSVPLDWTQNGQRDSIQAFVNPVDLISKDAGNALTQGADGRLKASGGDFISDIVVLNQ